MKITGSTISGNTGINAGGYALYLRDPDGIPMELFQPPAARRDQ